VKVCVSRDVWSQGGSNQEARDGNNKAAERIRRDADTKRPSAGNVPQEASGNCQPNDWTDWQDARRQTTVSSTVIIWCHRLPFTFYDEFYKERKVR